jgi:hypothetical protein
VVIVTDPYGRILGFLEWSRYFFFQAAPQLYSRGLVNTVPDPLLLRKSGSAGIEPGSLDLYPGTLTTRPQRFAYLRDEMMTSTLTDTDTSAEYRGRNGQISVSAWFKSRARDQLFSLNLRPRVKRTSYQSRSFADCRNGNYVRLTNAITDSKTHRETRDTKRPFKFFPSSQTVSKIHLDSITSHSTFRYEQSSHHSRPSTTLSIALSHVITLFPFPVHIFPPTSKPVRFRSKPV